MQRDFGLYGSVLADLYLPVLQRSAGLRTARRRFLSTDRTTIFTISSSRTRVTDGRPSFPRGASRGNSLRSRPGYHGGLLVFDPPPKWDLASGAYVYVLVSAGRSFITVRVVQNGIPFVGCSEKMAPQCIGDSRSLGLDKHIVLTRIQT